MENNITLTWGLEITWRITVLTWDQIQILYTKYMRNEIWDVVLTLEVCKLLLVDKSKASEIDSILNWEMTEETIEKIWEWWEKVLEIIEKHQNNKKKVSK